MKTFTWNRAQLYSKNFFSFVRSRLLGLQLGLFDFVDADTMPSEEKKEVIFKNLLSSSRCDKIFTFFLLRTR